LVYSVTYFSNVAPVSVNYKSKYVAVRLTGSSLVSIIAVDVRPVLLVLEWMAVPVVVQPTPYQLSPAIPPCAGANEFGDSLSTATRNTSSSAMAERRASFFIDVRDHKIAFLSHPMEHQGQHKRSI